MANEDVKLIVNNYVFDRMPQTYTDIDILSMQETHFIEASIPIINLKENANLHNYHSPWFDLESDSYYLYLEMLTYMIQDGLNICIEEEMGETGMILTSVVMARTFIMAMYSKKKKLSYRAYRAIYKEVNWFFDHIFLPLIGCLYKRIYGEMRLHPMWFTEVIWDKDNKLTLKAYIERITDDEETGSETRPREI